MKYTSLLLALLLVPASFLWATTIKKGSEVRIDQAVEDNLYVAAGELIIEAPILGNLTAAAGEAKITAELKDDVLLLGGDIVISAICGADLRVLSGTLFIEQDVLGDLVIAGGEVEIAEGVKVHGELVLAGGSVALNGEVLGDVYLTGGDVRLNGHVHGALIARGGSLYVGGTVGGVSSLAAQDLSLGPLAKFERDVRYWSPDGQKDFTGHLGPGVKARLDDSLKTKFSGVKKEWEHQIKKGVQVFGYLRTISGLLITLLLVAFFDRYFNRNTGRLALSAGPSIVNGVGLLLALPLLSGIAMITVIGFPLGIIGFSVYAILLALGQALVAVIASYEIEKIKDLNWNKGMHLVTAAGLFLGLRLLSYVPIGGWITFAAFVLAVGYLWWMLRHPVSNNGGEENPIRPEQELV